MARMHARRKGRSGSSAQTRKENPKWSPKAKDVEKLLWSYPQRVNLRHK